jgi:hypothetical protein
MNFLAKNKIKLLTITLLAIFILTDATKIYADYVTNEDIAQAQKTVDSSRKEVIKYVELLGGCQQGLLSSVFYTRCTDEEKQDFARRLVAAREDLANAEKVVSDLKKEQEEFLNPKTASSCGSSTPTLRYCSDGSSFEINSQTGIKCDPNFTCPAGSTPTTSGTGAERTTDGKNIPDTKTGQNKTTSSTSSAGGNSTLDGARDFINTIRRHAKFSLNLNNPNANFAQKNFEKEIAAAKESVEMIDNVEKLIDLLSKIESPIRDVDDADFDSAAPKILNLIDKIKNFQTNGENMSGSFDTLKDYVPGFDDPSLSSVIKKNIDSLSKITSYWSGNSSIQKISSGLYGIIGPLQLYQKWYYSSVSGVTSYSTYQKVRDAATYYNNLFSTLKKSISDLKKEFDAVSSIVKIDNLSDLSFSLENVLKNSTGDRFICQGMGATNRGSGSGEGLPAEEYRGPLLDYTGQLIDYTASIRTIDQKTCEMTYEILVNTSMLVLKEYKFDPQIREEARKLIESERAKMEELMKSGGVPLNDLDGQTSLYQTNQEAADQAMEVARNYHLDLIKKLKNAGMDDETAKSLAGKYEAENLIATEGKKSEFVAKTAPTFDTKQFLQSPPKGMAYLDGLVKASESRNNYYGQILLQNEQRRDLEQDFKERALNELNAGGGVNSIRECEEEITVGEGATAKKQCIKYKIKVPSNIVARTAEELGTSPIRQGENANEYGEINTLKQITNTVAQMATYKTPEVDYDNSGITLQSENITAVDQNIDSSFGAAKLIVTSSGGTTGGSSGGGGSGGGSGGGGSNPPDDKTKDAAPTPTITQTTRSVRGITKTTISWNDSGAEGRATNDWVTYFGTQPNTGTNPTPNHPKSPSKKTGDGLGKSGSVEISQPTPFGFDAYATGGNNIPVNSPQTNYSSTLTRSGNNIIQETTFTPNVSGLNTSSYISINIDNRIYSLRTAYADAESNYDLVDRPTAQGVAELIWAAFKDKIPGVTVRNIDSRVIFTKTVPISSLPQSATYNMTFKNNSGEAQKSVVVNF